MTLDTQFTNAVKEWAVANPSTFLKGNDRQRLTNVFYKRHPSTPKTTQEVHKTLTNQLGKFRTVFRTHRKSRSKGSAGYNSKDERKKRNDLSNPIYNPIYNPINNPINGPINGPINSKKRKQERKAANKKLLEETNLSSEKLSEEEVKAEVDKILNTVCIDGHTLQEAITSRNYAIYFGTTKNQLDYEALKFLTTRGRPTRGGKTTRNIPILQMLDDQGNQINITEKTARDQLGAKSFEVYVGRLRSNACDVEDELQKRNMDLHYPHRLYRHTAMGPKHDKDASDPDFCCSAFVTYMKIDQGSLKYAPGKHPGKNSAKSCKMNGYKVTIHP